MENKINIAELLKNYPKGIELDCLMYEDVYFDYVDEFNIIHCYIQHETYKTSLTFNQYGTFNSDIKSKCVIFPKGKTTWEGFQRPLLNGDVVVAEDDKEPQMFIVKEQISDCVAKCYIGYNFDDNKIFDKGNWGFDRLYYRIRTINEK